MADKVWVLFRTDGKGGVVLCGTAYLRSDADRWSDSGEARGAILVPLDGLADGETW